MCEQPHHNELCNIRFVDIGFELRFARVRNEDLTNYISFERVAKPRPLQRLLQIPTDTREESMCKILIPLVFCNVL